MNITPKQALENLYQASRIAKLTAEEHIILQLSKEILMKALPEEKTEK